MKNFIKCIIWSYLVLLLLVSCASEDTKLFKQALEFQKQEKYEQAIEVYQKIIDKYPDGQFVANANVKLNQCIDLIVKKGDELAKNKDYFKAVYYYEKALEFRANDIDVKNKRNNVKSLVSGEKTLISIEGADEYKLAIEVLSSYKGQKIEDFKNLNYKIVTLLKDWESAWESRNINLYSSFYDTNFTGISGNRTYGYYGWINYKSDLFNNVYTGIDISTQLIDYKLDGTNLKLYFKQWFQGYGANPYSDVTNKELIFTFKQKKGWLIISERPY